MINLDKRVARKMFWDLLASNVLFAVIAVGIAVQLHWGFWILAAIAVISSITHSFSAKKILVPGKLFERKKKKI